MKSPAKIHFPLFAEVWQDICIQVTHAPLPSLPGRSTRYALVQKGQHIKY